MKKVLKIDGIDLYNINLVENYLISKNGDVYSINTKKFLKPLTTGRGYKHYILRYNKAKIFYSQHVLLCLAFKYFKNCEELTVDHIDGNPMNNNLDNLEWVTIKENIRRYHRNRPKKIYTPIIVKDYKNNTCTEYNNYIHAAHKLGLHRYEVLRRLNNYFGFLFADYTMFKLKTDDRDFPIIDNLEVYRKQCQHTIEIKAYNHITGETKYFDKLKDAAEYIGYSIGRVSVLLKKNIALFKNGWELVRTDKVIPKRELKDFDLLTKHKTQIRINVNDNGLNKSFDSIKSVCEKYKFNRSIFDKHIKRNGIFQRGSIICTYLDR